MPHINSREPCYFAKDPDGPQTYTHYFIWFQAEGAQIHTSGWSQSFTFTKNVSRGFYAPRLLLSELSDSPLRWKCLLRVLCPVRRPETALDCVLLKDRNITLEPRRGDEISSRACLLTSARPASRGYNTGTS